MTRALRLAPLLFLLACGGHAANATPPRAPTTTASSPPPAPDGGAAVPPAARPRFVVHVADVGTGLAVFVQGSDFSLVYDGGSNDDLALGDKNRFVAFLHAVAPSLSRLDHVILSHPHRDHVELLADVVARYHPRDVWDSGAVNDICGYRRFLGAVATSTDTAYHSGTTDAEIVFSKPLCDEKLPPTVRPKRGPAIVEGTAFRLGDRATMTFLHVDAKVHDGNYNENSLVTVLDLDGKKVLFMGDAEAGGRDDPAKPPTASSVEGYLLAHHHAALDSDVLVVGHHGSKTSSRKALIDAVSPAISIISSGPTKYHGVTLPDGDVVNELTAVSKVYRTDEGDAACATEAHKIGPDADGSAGGCTNVLITIHAGTVSAEYTHPAD